MNPCFTKAWILTLEPLIPVYMNYKRISKYSTFHMSFIRNVVPKYFKYLPCTTDWVSNECCLFTCCRRSSVPLGSGLGVELVVFWWELVDVLEDVLLGVRQSAQKVLTLLRRQQLHETLQLIGADVVCHYAAATRSNQNQWNLPVRTQCTDIPYNEAYVVTLDIFQCLPGNLNSKA